MATEIDTLPPRTSTKLKQMKVSFTSHRNLAFQAAGLCGASCPTCTNENVTGACELPAGHQGNHQCERGHQWAAKPGEAPGPHGPGQAPGPH